MWIWDYAMTRANLTNNARHRNIYPYRSYIRIHTYIIHILSTVAHVTLAIVLKLYAIATDWNKFKEMKNNCLQLIVIFVCSFSTFQFRTGLS